MFGTVSDQQAFYTGGDPNYHNPNNHGGFQQYRDPNAQINEFRNAFKHFILRFSLNGENIYKEKIRRLDLLNCNRYGNEAGQEVRSTHGVPSISLDLEHLNMPHWLPGLQLTTNQTQTQSNRMMDDGMSQISEEEAGLAISQWGEILVDGFRQQPLRFIGLAEDVIREVYYELLTTAEREAFLETIDHEDDRHLNDPNESIQKKLGLFQLELISRTNPTTIRELGASSVESLVILSGIVIQAYKPQHKAIRIRIRCKQCEHQMTLKIPLWREAVELPRFCAASNNTAAGAQPQEARCPPDPYAILSDESEYCDVQTIKLQELPEHVPTGDMPRNVMLNAANSLCGRVVPGERILVVGVYSAFTRGRGGGHDADAIRTSYIHVLGLDYSESTGSRKQRVWKFSEEEQFQSMSRDPLIHQKIFRSIAPSLIGLEDIKKSIACLLFGGSRKCLPDGTRLRGDINILLLGDPSTAKSQFLKFVEKSAPISVYTSGKGSSAAGLTAAVIRDSNGNFALEGGAMVLADGGVVCIDEFDKMRDNDRVAIHEAMEQQTISMAKAGITTVLTTRCSVLAAANPTFGSYDDSKDTIEQHDFETTILSRFDLIWLVRDEKSVERDQVIAKHVLELHCGGGRGSDVGAPIPLQSLKEYINYCRSMCNPVLSEDAAKKLENFYVEVRESVRLDTRRRRDQIPITIRQLESLARISESLAKMSLSRFVTEQHVEEAIRLFKLSTVEAAKSNLARDNLTESERERVKAAEAVILSHLPLNARSSKSSILKELTKRGFDPGYTGRALKTLIQRGLLEERGDSTLRRLAGI